MKITAVVERSGSWWAITVPEVQGAFTQVRHVHQIEGMARSVVADLLEIDTTDAEVIIKFTNPAEGTERS